MNAIAHAPFFLPPHKGEPGGVDYLGLRAINLEMMDELLPGLNNVANRIRPFSLLAWTIWAYEDSHREHGTLMAAKEYALFREKIEALFIMSHQLAGISLTGTAGAQQRIDQRKLTTLKFPSMGRQHANSLINAVNYGPGLKGNSGYQFAYSHPEIPQAFLVTKAGARLALALDERLRKKLSDTNYAFLRALDDFEISTENVEAFATAWNIEKPSKQEKIQFFSRFYPTNSSVPQEQERSATLDLILAVVNSNSEYQTVGDIRRTMTMSNSLDLPDDVVRAQWRWRALQLRQAQRLALESLFGYIERCIWQEDMHSTLQYAARMTEAVSSSRPTWDVNSVLADRLAQFSGMAASAHALFESGWTNSECDIVSLSADLAQEMKNLSLKDDVIAQALDLLILVSVFTEHFLSDHDLKKYVINRSTTRLPLDAWAIMVRSRSGESLQVFLEQLIETWLISQHLGVAASRSSLDSSRMRLSIDDAGISSLLEAESQCWSPGLTADRVITALSLLSECGKIESYLGEDNQIYYLGST
ncbi:hypothetical protein DXT88_05900 [Herbaspirillum lusitanum]|uniref:hypothetical protein n=1 Tax=Herbaspirillum lusitanum TaxID=213312 RepID=UPI002238ABFE|nr:hypothetical protein [Herbaspirillum lusitanum]MCW5297705.1 hypothetical protein [Herbaspirillum lusitanum]